MLTHLYLVLLGRAARQKSTHWRHGPAGRRKTHAVVVAAWGYAIDATIALRRVEDS